MVSMRLFDSSFTFPHDFWLACLSGLAPFGELGFEGQCYTTSGWGVLWRQPEEIK